MYNIIAPVVENIDDFDFVIASRSRANRDMLDALRGDVAAAYEQYEAIGSSTRSFLLLDPMLLSSEKRDALSTNYDRIATGKPCVEIRDEILSRVQDGMCPYCRLQDATTLDHILEKVQYPEFSILRLNLAPVCGLCNTTKEHTRNLVRHLEPFHLYFRGFPVEDFLRVTVDRRAGRVEISIALSRPASVSKLWFEALERHFTGLQLARRYERRARSELRDRLLEMKKQHVKGGSARVATFLRRDAESRAANWSNQDWLPTVLRAAAQSTDFCDAGFELL